MAERPRRASDEDAAGELVAAGADLASGLVGGALGTIGGPAGVVAGAAGGVAVGHTLKKVGAAIRRRGLEPRQEARAGAAYIIAADMISARLLAGAELRDDGFFVRDNEAGGRSAAEEILEGTLRAAADEHEERKVPYLGRFFANLAFRDDIGRSYANWLLRLAERLTWRQYLLLGRCKASTSQSVHELDTPSPRYETEPVAINVAQLDDLKSAGLVGIGRQRMRHGAKHEAMADASPHDPNLADVPPSMSFADAGVLSARLTRPGSDLSELLGLADVPPEELRALGTSLRRSR